MAAAEDAACRYCPYSFPARGEDDIEQIGQQQAWSPLPLLLVLGAAAATTYLWMTIATSDSAGKASRQKPLSPRDIPAESAPQQYQWRPPREQGEAAAPLEARPVAGEAEPKEWRMRGVVYDLLTLSPLPGCRVVFRDEKINALYETVTDSRGRYRMILPPNDRGYAIDIRKEAYAAAYLDPSAEAVPLLPRGRREELARGLTGSVLSPAVLAPKGEEPLVTDFYMAPRD